MKKVYLLFLLALLPLFASAETVEINGIRYNVNPEAKTAEVTSNPNGYSGKVIIPKTITYGGADYRVTSIYEAAFRGWSGLTSVTIPNSVTSIGYIAFEGCSGLTSITIPTSVTSIDHLAFSGCSGLTSIIVKEGNTVYDSRDNCNAIIETASNKLISGCKNTTIPNSVTTIDYGAFSGCKGLTSITIPTSVTSIDHLAFSGCRGLTSIDIPNSVTSIGGSAFRDCIGLASIIIPSNVTSIGLDAFYNTSWYKNQPDGIVYAGKLLYKYKGTMPDGTIIKIEDETLGIVDRAFLDCSGLTSLTIPNSVISIGAWAFSGCTGLTSIAIPSSVTSISFGAFKDCSGLTSVTIPNSVTSIEGYAFYGCGSLTSVTIPASVTSIGSDAFTFCGELTSIIVEEGNTVYDSRNNCNAIIETESNTLIRGCKNTVIPNSVTSIGSNSFLHCNGMTSVIIPASVSYISIDAFTPTSLTEVYCFAKDVPDAPSYINGDGIEIGLSFILYNAIVYVPEGSVDAYKASSWGGCKEIVGFSGSVKLSKSKAAVEKGKTMTLKATVTLPEKSVTWKSSNTKVATVTSTGKVKGVKAGTATITCTSTVSGAKATCKVTVGYVTLDKSEAFVKKGKTLTLTPTVYPSSLTDKSVTWKSSDESIATVTSEGKVKGVKYGTATITCTSNATGLSTTSKVTVGLVKLDKTNATVEKGTTLTLKPTVYPSTLEDKSVTWTSSAKSIATVSSSGKVKGIKAGTATITCTSVATGLSATCKVTVINGTVTLNKTEAFIEKGKTTTLKATLTPTTLEDMSVTWTSSDKTVATVSSSGKVKGVGYGTATITCTSVATGVSATCTVTIGKVVINIPEFTLRRTRTATLAVTLYPTTLTDKSVTWKSSDTKVATVSSSGKVKGVGAGTATITCTSVATGLKGTCTVTVLAVSESRSIEGDDDEATGIDELENAPTEILPFDVYDLNGRKVAHQVTTLDGLPNGLYIVNGKKMLKK